MFPARTVSSPRDRCRSARLDSRLAGSPGSPGSGGPPRGAVHPCARPAFQPIRRRVSCPPRLERRVRAASAAFPMLPGTRPGPRKIPGLRLPGSSLSEERPGLRRDPRTAASVCPSGRAASPTRGSGAAGTGALARKREAGPGNGASGQPPARRAETVIWLIPVDLAFPPAGPNWSDRTGLRARHHVRGWASRNPAVSPKRNLGLAAGDSCRQPAC